MKQKNILEFKHSGKQLFFFKERKSFSIFDTQKEMCYLLPMKVKSALFINNDNYKPTLFNVCWEVFLVGLGQGGEQHQPGVFTFISVYCLNFLKQVCITFMIRKSNKEKLLPRG